MKNICFYFEIHQPLRLKRYRFFDIGQDHYYYDDFQAEERIRGMVEQSYLPANRTIAENDQEFKRKIQMRILHFGSGTRTARTVCTRVIDSLVNRAKTGSVEFLAEPYAHSLASLYDTDEFVEQVNLHADKIEQLAKDLLQCTIPNSFIPMKLVRYCRKWDIKRYSSSR